MSIIDTHLHLIYPDRLRYPWLSNVPAIDRPWHVEDYFAEATPLGIEAALHMEVDVAPEDTEAETRFVTALHPKLVGAIAGCRPGESAFAEWLEIASTIGGVKAMRQVLHSLPDETALAPLYIENLKRLPAYGLPFDLCIRAEQLLTVGKPLIEKCPHVQFVLDHMALQDADPAKFPAWQAGIAELARLPNLVCKISGVCGYIDQPTPEKVRPYVEHAISCFGWERVVWGSDHPVVTQHASLTRWVEITQALLDGASLDEKARLLRENARRVYRLE
jgi:predicted TIM-barrel fold metal-dependent hydrolase